MYTYGSLKMLKEITKKLFESERGTSFSLLDLLVNKRALANGRQQREHTEERPGPSMRGAGSQGGKTEKLSHGRKW